ncbi:MAG: tRNA (adenosine(37)-N6)-threonylcarbamoyltransferase complex transferase subunit TsaD [Spirochaetia bacterium]|jgi:N6-L-threonylcarbamoyladenine synthase|nr:tRNA (adenosine(37)-N6)-threonylcarbamoyltransferase complex transferase subunit TsaD [Spirochaetia bacterium]
MLILGIESSCDECSAAVVEDGKQIRSNIIATQIPLHEQYQGVVPEIASRAHVRWIETIVRQAMAEAGIKPGGLDGIAATAQPGLIGSLAVGLSFAKAMALALGIPFKGVNHMLAHLYAPQLSSPVEYPFLGLLVSGGHSIICKATAFDTIEILGTTIDDAVGEAFDKVATHYNFGYPGGKAIDDLAEKGDATAFRFSPPSLHKGEHRYDLSYSGLKTAVIHHLESFKRPGAESSPENIAASFRKAAIDLLLSKLLKASTDTGIKRIVAGGGVAANAYLRRSLAARSDLDVRFPPLELCGDNGAMVAGIAYHYFTRGESDGLDLAPQSRIPSYKRSLEAQKK